MSEEKKLLLFLPENALAQLESMANTQHKSLNELILEIVDDGLESERKSERLGGKRDQDAAAQLISIVEGLKRR